MLLPVWERSAILSFVVQTRIRKNSCVMYSASPAYIDVGEMTKVIYNTLHDNGVPSRAVVVICGAMLS